jgi:hypothetical protein
VSFLVIGPEAMLRSAPDGASFYKKLSQGKSNRPAGEKNCPAGAFE